MADGSHFDNRETVISP